METHKFHCHPILCEINFGTFWISLVRCPKWLFDKFNILEFKRRGCQKASGPTDILYKVRRKCMSENNFSDRTKCHEKRPKCAGPIYFHADVHISEKNFWRSHQMAQKKAQIRRPDLFPRGCMSENKFWDHTKWHKKGPNMPAQFIFTRMYVRKQFLEIAPSALELDIHHF